MPTPLAGGQEISFAPQMIFLWPPARGVGKLQKLKVMTLNQFKFIRETLKPNISQRLDLI